jgi:transposase
VLAGIDVSARELVIALQREGAPEPLLKVPNTAAGHRALIRALTARKATARVILEATGVYSLELALALHQAERVEVMVVNPRSIKDYQRARLTRAKTDRVDALGLLDFLCRMPFVPWAPPAPEVLALQQITRRMGQLRAELTREEARLHALAYTPDRGGVIGHDLTLNIAHLQRRLKALHTSALELVKAHPALQAAVDRLSSAPGIAHVSAMRLLTELLVLPAHLKAPQWVAHAGLDPRPCESGSSLHKPRHITRTGNRYLRTALFMPAMVAIQRDAKVKAFYEALLARGKRPRQAIVAVMRKLLHCLWGMLRSGQDFDPSKFYSSPQNA